MINFDKRTIKKFENFLVSALNNLSVGIKTKRALFFYSLNFLVLMSLAVILFLFIGHPLKITFSLVIINFILLIIFINRLDQEIDSGSVLFGYLIFMNLFKYAEPTDVSIIILFFVSLKNMTIKEIKLFCFFIIFYLASICIF